MWLEKGTLKRETESLQIAAESKATRTNHIKTRIDKMQKKKNSRCSLCSYRDEMINHITNESYKLVQKEYQTRHDRASKLIHKGLC